MQRWACIACNSFVILRFSLIVSLLGSVPLQAAEPAAGGCTEPAYRAFDFWLGDWVVELADGRKAGSNQIRASEDGCFLTETWTGAQGGRGFSLNFYQPGRDRWRQVWVSGGSIIEIEGNPPESNPPGSDPVEMVLVGKILDRVSGDSHPFRGRWSLLDDGRVRQFFEERPEAGWKPWFEGFYTKVVE